MFRSITKVVAIVATTALAMSAAACGGDSGGGGGDGDVDSITIGFVGSLTGPFAPSGKSSLAGLKAGAKYLEQQNEGLKVTIKERDTKGEPTAAVAATRALAQEKVSALYYSTEAFAPVQDVLNQVKIPGSTAGGIASILDEVGDSNRYKYAFSTGAGTAGPTSIEPLLAYAASAGTTVAVLDDSTAFGTSQRELTEQIAKENYPEVKIVKESFPATASDVTSQLNKLKNSGAESLIVWSYGAPLVATMSSLDKIGWTPQMSGVLGIGDPATAELIPEGMKSTLAAGPMAKTFLSTDPGAKPTGIAADFVKLYLEQQDKSEFNALDTVGAVTFDWVLIVQQAAKKAGSTDSQKIKDVLVSGESFDGANGSYTFGPDERIGIGADQLGVFTPAQPCEFGMCVESPIK